MKKTFTVLITLLIILLLENNPFLIIKSEAYSLDDALKFLNGKSENNEEEGEGGGSMTIEKPKYLVGVDEVSAGDATDVVGIIQKIANTITGIIATIAVLFIVINGAMLVISNGNSDQINNVKKGLTWGGIGLLMIIFAYIIVRTIIAITYTGQ